MPIDDLVQCDVCGGWYTIHELVETIEEYLCAKCASGIDEDDFDDDGFGDGFCCAEND